MYIVLNQYEVSHVYLGDYLGNQKIFRINYTNCIHAMKSNKDEITRQVSTNSLM